jgi:hypothetical protein
VVLAVLLLFVAGRCLVPMDETDLFFNLRLGEIVLGTGRVPTTNLLSFTAPNAPDVNLAWVFQIVLALAYRLGGIPGTVVLKTALVVATWGVLYLVARRRGASAAAAVLCLALAAWAAEPRFVERPHLMTFLGLALLLFAIERSEAGKPRMLWLFVPAGVVWANANSCFFLAPVLLALYGAGAAMEGRRTDARRALLVAAALAPLVFATPSGAGCLRYLANHFRMPWVRPLEEYRTASWPVDGPFFFLVAALAVAWVAGRLPLRRALPLLALGLLGSRRIRFVAEFAILAGPALAAALPALEARAARWSRPAAAAVLLVLTLVPRLRVGARGLDLGLEPGLVPDQAVDFVEREGLRGRMYNDMEAGSYLCWRGWPRFRVFQDPRINGYPDEMHAVLRRADLGPEQWQRFLDGFQVDAALITYPDVNPRGAWFSPALWALVYRSDEALVFTRRVPARQALIAARELPLGFAYEDGELAPRPLDAPPAGSPVPPDEWQRRLVRFHRESRQR